MTDSGNPAPASAIGLAVQNNPLEAFFSARNRPDLDSHPREPHHCGALVAEGKFGAHSQHSSFKGFLHQLPPVMIFPSD